MTGYHRVLRIRVRPVLCIVAGDLSIWLISVYWIIAGRY